MHIALQLSAIVLASLISYFASIFMVQNIAAEYLLPVAIILAASLSLLCYFALKRMIPSRRHRRPARPVPGPRRQGTIKWFNTKRQFGFITVEGGDDIFVHKRFINADRRQRIREGMKVQFSVSETDKGLQAENVDILD